MRKYWVAAIAVFLVVLATDALPALRGGSGWQWPYQKPDNWTPVVVLAGVVASYIIGVLALRRWIHAPTIHLLWAIVGLAVITLSSLRIQDDDPFFLLFARTVSPVQTGASTVAVRSLADNGVHDTLAAWPDVMSEAKPLNIIHFTTHPPGQPLVHYWVAEATNDMNIFQDLQMRLRRYQCSNPNVMRYSRGEIVSVGIVGMLMPLWAALTVIPLFFSVRLLSGDTQVATTVTAWWALVPSIALFTPTWNTFYPFLCTLAFYFLLASLMRNRGWLMLFAGIILASATMLSFSVMPLGLLFALFVAGYGWTFARPSRSNTKALQWIMRHGLWFGVGFMAPWTFFWFYSGTSPFEIFNTGITNHDEIVQRADYVVWIFLHLYDLFLFAGWALVGLTLGGMVWAVQRWRHREYSPLALLGIVLAITMIVVAISGTAQGETARLLTFYIPFMLMVAAPLLRKNKFDWPLLVIQGAMLVVLAAFVPVIPLDLNPPREGPNPDLPMFEVDLIHVMAPFESEIYEGRFYLQDYRYIPDVGAQVINLETHWLGDQPTERPYLLRVVATANNEIDGDIVTEPFDWYPQREFYLTTCWREGDLVRDVVTIPLPTVAAPVQWTLHLQAYDLRTGDLIPAEPVELGPINYP